MDHAAEWAKLAPDASRLVTVLDGVTNAPVEGAWVEIAIPAFEDQREYSSWMMRCATKDECLARFGQRARTDAHGTARIPLSLGTTDWIVARDGNRYGSWDSLMDGAADRSDFHVLGDVQIRLYLDEAAQVRLHPPDGGSSVGCGLWLQVIKDGKLLNVSDEPSLKWFIRCWDPKGIVELAHVQELRRRLPPEATASLVTELIATNIRGDAVPVRLLGGDVYDVTTPPSGSFRVAVRRSDGMPLQPHPGGYISYLEIAPDPTDPDDDDTGPAELPFLQEGDSARIDGVPLGQRFRFEGFAGDDLQSVVLEIAGPTKPGEVVRVALTVSELLPKVRVRLLDPSGAPLRHVYASAASKIGDLEEDNSDPWVPHWTDDEGRIELPVRCSRAAVEGRKLALFATEDVELGPDGKLKLREGRTGEHMLTAELDFAAAIDGAVLELGDVKMELSTDP